MSATTSARTLAAALRGARARGLERLDAQLLLGHVLGRSRAWLLAHDDAVLEAEPALAYEALVARRAAGEPFAYLVGEREFHGLTLRVDAAVLVPRPDTETLVDWALELLGGALGHVSRPRVLDLGTGSGAIALALKAACQRAEVWATERSAAALAVARANADRLGLAVSFAQGDWWMAVDDCPDGQRFDLVVSNPPYLAEDDPHLPALAYEPVSALVATDHGLGDIRTIAAGARAHLQPQGWLLFEHGWEQAPAVRDMLAGAGFAQVSTRTDIEDRPRCSGGCLSAGDDPTS